MNLVVLTKQFGNYTGATVSTIEILKRISKKFDTVEVVTMKAEKIVIPNIKIIVASNYLELVRILKSKKSEKKVYGYSDDHLGFLFNLAGINYIHTYHGNWPDAKSLSVSMFLKSFIFIPLYIMTIKNAEKVVSVSKYMNKNFVKKHSNNSVVIYNGVKNNNLSSNHNVISKIHEDFIMVGNIDSRKYKKALPIFRILKANNFNGNIDIYGSLIDKKIVHKMKKYDFVNIKGQVNKINYSKYDVLLCTSFSENLPVSIVEAILSRTPVISFNVGGIKEVVIDNVTGKLISPNDVVGFAKAVKTFTRCIVTEDVRERINNKFNWDYSAKKYFKLLSSERNSK